MRAVDVWLVLMGEYSQAGVVAVFSTKDAAEQCARECGGYLDRDEPFVVDAAFPPIEADHA